MTVAQEFSPRVERVSDHLLSLDVGGLERWFQGSDRGAGRAVGEALRRTAADRGLGPHVAVASTRTAALLLARGRAGLTVVESGDEAARLASLPLTLLSSWAVPDVQRVRSRKTVDALPLATLQRWGLKSLGDLATLPAVDLSERLGQEGVVWQRLARGEDLQPLVPALPDECFEESLALEWPIDQLEPLSFVLGRLFDALCSRLEQADRGVVVLHVRLELVGRERFVRMLQLPAPMRDARTLRTLALLDLESNPPPAAIDRVTVAADVVEGRVLQFSLLARALPAERLSTLLARLSALMGAERVGAPALVDSYRPGVFAMTPFAGGRQTTAGGGQTADGSVEQPPAVDRLPAAVCRPPAVVRRFRRPIPVRVDVYQGRPIRVASERRHLRGGSVVVCAGPWRSSGEWWSRNRVAGASEADVASRGNAKAPAAAATSLAEARDGFRRAEAGGPMRTEKAPAAAATSESASRGAASAWGWGPMRTEKAPAAAATSESASRGAASAWGWGPMRTEKWDRDEWDVTLRDGASYVIFRDRPRDSWFIDGILD
jgi:protein ImuB